jgi:hypothetical protein
VCLSVATTTPPSSWAFTPSPELQKLRPCKNKIQLRSFHERAKVSISRKQYNARIDASLRDQCVTKARPAPRRHHLRSQDSGALPESRPNLHLRYLQEHLGNFRWELRIAQQLGENRWHHHDLAFFKRSIELFRVVAGAPF